MRGTEALPFWYREIETAPFLRLLIEADIEETQGVRVIGLISGSNARTEKGLLGASDSITHAS